MFKNTYHSPLGEITILSDDQYIRGLWFMGQEYYGAGYDLGQVSVGQPQPITTARQWLTDYFAGKNPDPQQVPLAPETTVFRQKIYQVLRKVPYGRTITYKELSDVLQVGSPTKKNKARAVGNAVGHNPILLLIPCHRVLGSDGSLTGYAAGLERKKVLLRLEKGDNHATDGFTMGGDQN